MQIQIYKIGLFKRIKLYLDAKLKSEYLNGFCLGCVFMLVLLFIIKSYWGVR